ncbi:MAG TPA: polysaccharide deacetylase family protein [Candidatus Acidoferrales bacterium]|nr:polysaccharide deacetylase family protein [Candidatus Acidoferrales bacterium]
MEPLAWPDNAKIAVLITVMLESWSEGKAPPYSPMTTALRPGTLDLLGISWSEYGGKTGIWRIARILESFGVKATVCANAKCAELYPDAVRRLADGGHEIAAHSYTQDTILPYLSADEERDIIRRSAGILERATGCRPRGWFSPVAAPTPRTAEFLAEENFLWHGDYNDTDFPYALTTAKGTLVAIPHSDFTDNRVLRASPADFLAVYRTTFDYLYENEPAGMINFTVHAHFGGRPLMSAMIFAALKYFKQFPRVWFARHDEVAEWVLRNGH